MDDGTPRASCGGGGVLRPCPGAGHDPDPARRFMPARDGRPSGGGMSTARPCPQCNHTCRFTPLGGCECGWSRRQEAT